MCRWLPTCSHSRLPTPIDRRSGCTLGVNLRHRECLVCEFANVKPAFAVGRKAVLVLAILLVPFVCVVVACMRVKELSPRHRHAVVPDVLIEILSQPPYLQRRPPRGIHKVATEYGIGICHGVLPPMLPACETSCARRSCAQSPPDSSTLYVDLLGWLGSTRIEQFPCTYLHSSLRHRSRLSERHLGMHSTPGLLDASVQLLASSCVPLLGVCVR